MAASSVDSEISCERTAAVNAREDAIRRRGRAEALIGFMLGDLRAKLTRVGRLDVDARRLLADACLAAADVAQRRHEPARAPAFRKRARDTLQPLVATLKDRRFQLAWARALLGVGRTQEAAAVVASLRSTGFRRDVLDALAPARVAPGESPRPIDTPGTVP